jgi:hypothetical protein
MIFVVFDDDDPRRKVLLFRHQGWPNDRIALEMGTTEEVVARLAAEAEVIRVRYLAENRERLEEIREAARPRYAPDERRNCAQSLLDGRSGWGSILSVTESGLEGWTYNVRFNDLASTVFADLVAETVALLQDTPGVSEVIHEDRELILVAAPTIAREDLKDHLQDWWKKRLEEAART